MPWNLDRVAVIGTSCSGKTTLARRLASFLGTRHVELDSLHWGPEWTPEPDFLTKVLEAVEQPRWVIEGNYSRVRDIVWRRSTSIVWLDYSFARVFSRALGRTVRRIVTRESLYSGNRETFRRSFFDLDGIPWWVLRTHQRRRREFPELFRRPEYAHAALIRLRSPAAAEEFLARLGAGASARARDPAE